MDVGTIGWWNGPANTWDPLDLAEQTGVQGESESDLRARSRLALYASPGVAFTGMAKKVDPVPTGPYVLAYWIIAAVTGAVAGGMVYNALKAYGPH